MTQKGFPYCNGNYKEIKSSVYNNLDNVRESDASGNIYRRVK